MAFNRKCLVEIEGITLALDYTRERRILYFIMVWPYFFIFIVHKLNYKIISYAGVIVIFYKHNRRMIIIKRKHYREFSALLEKR